MRRFLAILSFLILFGFIVTAILCFVVYHHKAEIVKRVAEQLIRKQLPNASIQIGSADLEIPDELHFSRLTINDPSTRATVRLDSLVIEFEPAKIRQIIHRTHHLEGINRIYLYASDLKVEGFTMQGIEVTILIDDETEHIRGSVNARKILYKKFILNNVQTDFDVKNKVVRVDLQKVTLGEGNAHGSIMVDYYGDHTQFNSNIVLNRLQSKGIINLLDLKDKMELTGIWDGDVTVSGVDTEVTHLSGILTARADGGTMHLLDKVMAQNMLPANQPYREKLMDSIMHYTYTDGTIDISLEDMNILFNLKLNGETGKRTFGIYLHDLL